MHENEIKSLLRSPKKKFQNWDKEKSDVPEKPGVYIVWNGGQFLYTGMAKDNKKGLCQRLNMHVLGQRGGDQFCCKVCDAFIIPFLSKEQIEELKKGVNIFDGKKGLINKFVRENLEYQFLVTADTITARQIEETLRSNGISLKRPFLNPKKSKVIE